MSEAINPSENLWGVSQFPLPRGPVYTDEEIEELEMFDKMEKEWRATLHETLPRTLSGWMQVFPEAIKPARRGLKEKLKRYQQEIRIINENQDRYYDEYIAKAHFSEQEEIKKESDKEFDDQRLAVNRKIRKAQFELSYLNELEGKGEAKTGNGVTEADIERAKQVPIETFFSGHLRKHGRLAVGKCPLHNEKTGSFTIYLDQNSWWCYGCQEGGSVVDFVMKQNGVDFLTATKQLLK